MAKKHAKKIRPVQSVMVSAKVGDDSRIAKLNEEALGKLFSAHSFDIKNSNGDTSFTLTDLEHKIVEAADSYVFLPIPKAIHNLQVKEAKALFREMFKAASLIVGKQTKDPKLRINPEDENSPNKPIVFVNDKGCWDPFFELIEHMHQLGTIRQKPDELITKVDNISQAIAVLEKAHDIKTNKAVLHGHEHSRKNLSRQTMLDGQEDPQAKKKPDFSVCVFCSASTKNPELINIARVLGNKIASKGWGLVSGMGCTGMMGAVVEGANEVITSQKKGWVGGSNLPRIINMEGLPERYDTLWLKDDIYTRMEVMIEQSQAFVIMPGGTGTVQELMALLLLKHAHEDKSKPYLMRDGKYGNKPIVLVNYTLTHDGKETKFWDPLVKLAKTYGFENDIVVVDTVKDAVKALEERKLKKEPRPR
jgi:uncharacterized protein (TIGR00730 family)